MPNDSKSVGMFLAVKYCLSKVTAVFVWRFLFFASAYDPLSYQFRPCQGTQTFDQLFLSTVGLIYPRGHDLGNFMFIFSNVLYDRAICYFLYYKNR